MKLFGFALLPNVETQKEIISFRRQFSDIFFGPMLSLSENLPHISILQCPFSENIPIKDIIENANSHFQLPITLTWDELIYQPVGWVFANVQKIPVLFSLQTYLLEQSEKYINRSSINPKKSTKGYTKEEIDSYFQYGYRYIGEAYKPHVTIGKIDEFLEIPLSAVLDFNENFSEQEVVFNRIIYYEAGEYGVAKRIIF